MVVDPWTSRRCAQALRFTEASSARPEPAQPSSVAVRQPSLLQGQDWGTYLSGCETHMAASQNSSIQCLRPASEIKMTGLLAD